MRTKEIFYTIEWNKETGEERELVVEYTYYAGTNFPIHSASLEPNDPEEIELLSAKMHSPTAHDREHIEDVLDDLSDKDKESIMEKIREKENEDCRDYGD